MREIRKEENFIFTFYMKNLFSETVTERLNDFNAECKSCMGNFVYYARTDSPVFTKSREIYIARQRYF